MPYVFPESVPVLGNIKVHAFTTLASRSAPSLAGFAANGEEMSGAFMADGWKPSTSQGKSNRMRRLASTSDVERLNPAQHTIGTLMWSQGDPQDPDGDIASLMVEGALIYFMERLGVDADEEFAAGDKVRTHYLRLGVPYPVYDPSADNGEFYMACEAEYVDNGPTEGTIAA